MLREILKRFALIGGALLLAAQAGVQTTPQPPDASGPPAPPPAQWVPRSTVELKMLDKINARSLTLTGNVGQTLQFGTLSINVKGCDVRPPDQPADAAASLTITDSRPGQPSFNGWMFENEPGLNIFESPVYDVRVAGCGGS